MRDIACADCVVGALITERDEPAADTAAAPDEQHGDRMLTVGRRGERPDGHPGWHDGSRRGHGSGVPVDHPGEPAPATGAPRPEIGEQERRALRTLASAGLVPPLRLAIPDPDVTATDGDHSDGFPDAAAS
jgi:hypothetical protein